MIRRSRTHTVVLAMAMLGLLLGCAANQAAVKTEVPTVATAPQDPPEYLIQAGDQLDIKFFYNPELNETVFVRPDGKISLQLVHEVQAAGVSPSQLDKNLTQEYVRELRKPEVTVIVKSFSGQRVYVGGEVNTQGLVNLTAGMTALQAVINAGGFKETAKPDGAIVIRKGADNQPIPLRVDLQRVIYEAGAAADVRLQPYDIVYVPKTWIAEANKFVKQYIEDLLLFRGVSFGFSYEVHSDSKTNR